MIERFDFTRGIGKINAARLPSVEAVFPSGLASSSPTATAPASGLRPLQAVAGRARSVWEALGLPSPGLGRSPTPALPTQGPGSAGRRSASSSSSSGASSGGSGSASSGGGAAEVEAGGLVGRALSVARRYPVGTAIGAAAAVLLGRRVLR